MVNYTNLNDPLIPQFQTDVTTGLNELFGDPLITGLFGLLVIVILGHVLDLDIDTRILSGVTMIFILMGAYLPEWIFWITLIPLGIYGGVIFSRIIHK